MADSLKLSSEDRELFSDIIDTATGDVVYDDDWSAKVPPPTGPQPETSKKEAAAAGASERHDGAGPTTVHDEPRSVLL